MPVGWPETVCESENGKQRDQRCRLLRGRSWIRKDLQRDRDEGYWGRKGPVRNGKGRKQRQAKERRRVKTTRDGDDKDDDNDDERR